MASSSENKVHDSTSFGQTEAPILCANGCGFFGTAATMNLCSKCFRDHRLKEEQAASAIAASINSKPLLSPRRSAEEEKKKLVDVKDEKEVEEAAPIIQSVEEVETDTVSAEKPKNRCGSCNRKVGVLGFKCRCGMTFCGSHRYPEAHGCEFDFKGVGREAIAKANPVVKADKVERF